MTAKFKSLITLFLTIFTILTLAYLFLPDYFQSLDSRVRDLYFNFRGAQKASDDIVIVDIDEKSLKELGQWPWERDKLAKILDNLANAGAGIIGLDIVFSESDKTSPTNLAKKWNIKASYLPDYDLIFAKTVAGTPTILGYVFDFDHNNSSEAPQIPTIFIQKYKIYGEFLPEAKGVLTNLPVIQNAGYSSGYMNNIPDEGGIIRSVPMFIAYDMQIYPSLALEMYRLATDSRITLNYSQAGIESIHVGKQAVKCDRFGRIHLNFRGPFKSYKYISAIDVYNNNIDKDIIRNKFVLIGTSAYGLMDLRSTPMDSVIAGVEVHANVIDNLLHSDMLFKPSWVELGDLFIIFLTSAFTTFILSRFSLIVFIPSYILLFGTVLYANYYMMFDLNLILNSIFPIFSLILSLIGVLGINYMFESRLKDSIKKSFSKKVSQQVMDDLLANPDSHNFSSKEVNATIYFSDIRSFTTISETLKSPKLITEFLNFYMNEMVIPIEKSSGTIDKFIGDAVMAYWNAPIEVKNHADKAVTTALEQIRKRDELNITIFKKFGFNVDYGIGINTGDAVVGEIGSYGRSDYTIIGDAVNLASRLEGLCKPYKVRLVISEFTKENLTQEYIIQLLDIVRVKGKTEPVKIYEVLDVGRADGAKEEELHEYEEAHLLYVNGDFSKAKEIFEKLFVQYSKYLYDMYAKRCYHLIEENVQNFDGVFEFQTK